MNKILEKYNKLPLTIKAVFWFTICNFILKGISFITVPLFTRILPAEEYGTVSVFSSYEQIFLIFATFELSLGAYQRGIIKFKDEYKLFTSSLIILTNMITFVLFIVVYLFKQEFINLTDTNVSILIMMFSYFLFQPAYNCWMSKKRFDYDYKPVVLITLLFTIITTGGTLLAFKYIENTAIMKVSSLLFLEILFCSLFYMKNVNLKCMLNNKKKVLIYWSYSLKYQIPLVLHSLSFLILGQSDRMMIAQMVGKYEVALYSVAYSLANVVIIFQTSINQVLKPWRFRKLELKQYDEINRTTKVMLALIGTLIIIFILVSPEIMKLLFNDQYYEAIWTIPPVSLSVYFMFLYSVFTDVEAYFSKTKYIMYASITCAILNIFLNLIGIELFGYIACAYTTLISYIMFSLLHYFFMKKVSKQEGIRNNIFNVRYIIIISLFFIVLMITSTLLFQFMVIRYMILFFGAVIIYIKRNILFSLYTYMKK